MLSKLLGNDIYNLILEKTKDKLITEIRLRLNRRITVKTLDANYQIDHVVDASDFNHVVGTATQRSLYAYQDDIKRGFLSYNGIRIGLCGEGVTDDKNLITIKNFSSLIIRIPHEIKGVSEKVFARISKDRLQNVLVVSPPYGGKTTLIRDIARVYSKTFDTLIIDERNEIYDENFAFGDNIDVFKSTPKSLVVENLIRGLSPELIVVDELFPSVDYKIIKEITRSGINIIASIHAPSVEIIKTSFPDLLELFDVAVVLSNKPSVGNIKSFIRL